MNKPTQATPELFTDATNQLGSENQRASTRAAGAKIDDLSIKLTKDCPNCSGLGKITIYDYFLEQLYADMAEFETKPCPRCQGKGYLTETINSTEAESWLTNKLQSFDWYHAYADSAEVSRRAEYQMSLIKDIMKILPNNIATTLWNKYCPYSSPAG